jgi:DNA modification methylase
MPDPRRISVRYDRLEDLAARMRPENPKLHDLGAIGASINRFGYVDPVIINDADGQLLAGHGRVEELLARRAAGGLPPDGIEADGTGAWLVPAVHGIELGLADAHAFLVAANRTVELGGWDEARLGVVLTDLVQADGGLAGVGFGERELGELLTRLALPPASGQSDPDDEPELPEDAALYVRPGQLWGLGEHRLLCGDATAEADMARLLGGRRAAMCATDPPWGVSIGGDTNPRHRQRPGLLNDDLPPAEFAAFLGGFAHTLRPHLAGDLYCVLGAASWPLLDGVLREAGFHWSATIAWVKQQFVLGRSNYHRRYEPVWYGWPAGLSSSYCGGRAQDDVWEVDRPLRSPEHPTMKPVALIERMVANSSLPGSVVLDPFLGSGTTLVAAERLGRRCFGLELDPRYAQGAIERWQQFTGKQAVSLEDGDA